MCFFHGKVFWGFENWTKKMSKNEKGKYFMTKMHSLQHN
jgi:hypothetical protein